MSRKQIDDITTLIANRLPADAPGWSDFEVRRFITGVGPDLLEDFVFLAKSEFSGAASAVEGFDALDARMKHQLGVISAFRVRDLAVSGGDVMESLGLTQGREVGKVLDRLFLAVLEDPALNSRERLLEIVKRDFSG